MRNNSPLSLHFMIFKILFLIQFDERRLMTQLRSQSGHRRNFTSKVSWSLRPSSNYSPLILNTVLIFNKSINLLLIPFSSSWNTIDTSTICLWIDLAKEIRRKIDQGFWLNLNKLTTFHVNDYSIHDFQLLNIWWSSIALPKPFLTIFRHELVKKGVWSA